MSEYKPNTSLSVPPVSPKRLNGRIIDKTGF